jgi:Sigma-70 region 2
MSVTRSRAALRRDLETLYLSRHRAFVRVATAITGTDTGGVEAVQEGFAQALAALGTFRDEGPLEAWVYTIIRSDGRQVDDVLETPEGSYTPGGIVYDCAWIAAHPVEATKARVSCNASGNNGTTPRVIPRPKPSIDPGLQGFLDGYQQALATGKARKIGTGEIGGRPVVWLAFDLPDRGSEQVAVDSETMRPLLIRNEPGSYSYRIEQIGTESSEEANFKKPTLAEVADQPSAGGVISSKSLPLTPSSIGAALPGAVWAGNPLGGLPLTSARRDELRTSFAHHTRPPETGVGLRLEYGSGASGAYVLLMESKRPQFGYQWGRITLTPSGLSGKLYYYNSAGAAAGFTVANGIYTTIDASNHELLIRAARTLRPANRGAPIPGGTR